jgi:hypothetical protein
MVLPSPILARKDFGSNGGLRLVAVAGGLARSIALVYSKCLERPTARAGLTRRLPAWTGKSPTTIFPVDPSGGACSAQTRRRTTLCVSPTRVTTAPSGERWHPENRTHRAFALFSGPYRYSGFIDQSKRRGAGAPTWRETERRASSMPRRLGCDCLSLMTKSNAAV